MSEDNPPPTQAHGSATGTSTHAVLEQPMVQETESGQKLLQFLQRRLNLPPTLLHRWVRTGQVRINGSRCKPFARVQAGDIVRLPPFAFKLAETGTTPGDPQAPINESASNNAGSPPLPPMIGTDGYLWAFNKPAGLPTHPGTGHEDSLSSRLAAYFADAPFRPVPVHRLDKETSGVLLVAASFEALAKAQEALRAGALAKEYVVWVQGAWPYEETQLLRHFLRKDSAQGYEKVRIAAPGEANSREALCLVRPLRVAQSQSLLLVRLLTGRTHQIRVQLAAMGHPVLGDPKYGAAPRRHVPRGAYALPAPARAGGADKKNPQPEGLMLHALRVTMPCGRIFSCLPSWVGEHALTDLPDPVATASAPQHGDGCGAFPLAEQSATNKFLRQ
ncbi:RluA family pseudouridine synthase [Desulfovibrio desulfuricans]|nr:RluA family pseudouridine synthase [Desulfovibrio desulfuricans]